MVTRTKKAKVVTKEAPAAKELEVEEIAARAYIIHESGEGGDAVENWLRAEQELRSRAGGGITA